MGNATITISGHRTYDEYGDPTDSSDSESLDGYFAPTSTADIDLRGRAGSEQAGTVYVKSAVDLSAGDRLTIDGDVWEVDGDPKVWKSPYSTFVGTEIAVRRTVG